MKEHVEKNIGLLIFMVIWAGLMAWFWIGDMVGLNDKEAGFAQAFSLAAFYVLLPSASVVAGALYGMSDGKNRFVFPVFAGIMEVLTGFLTFDLLNALVNSDDKNWIVYFKSFLKKDTWSTFFFAFIPALAGVLAGILYQKMKGK